VKKLGTEYDPMTKLRVDYYPDGEGGLLVYESQEVGDTLELNKAQFAQTDERERWTPLNDAAYLGRHVARIPLQILGEWQRECKKRGYSQRETDEFIKRKLDDRDNALFRTFPGKLSK
jgi:hypothetical protein